MRISWRSAILGAVLLAVSAGLPVFAGGGGDFGGRGVKRVLLISIDGIHALDFINCAQGISGVNGGNPYCPNLAELAETGVNYLEASTSKPSDSFPGLMALVTGGSPRTVGAFYDVAYDRSLDPPATTTGNGVAGAPGRRRRRATSPASARFLRVGHRPDVQPAGLAAKRRPAYAGYRRHPEYRGHLLWKRQETR